MRSNLPPGVTESMIPGSRPEDQAWEDFHEQIDRDTDDLALVPEAAAEVWIAGLAAYGLRSLIPKAKPK